ncbi:MAG: hypothetical protein ABSE82_03720, partial [Nitrososphaerales archaeon]
AGIVASIVMTISVIVVTALGFLSIQWFPWVGSVLGANGMGASLAEVGVAWFFALGIIAGLIFAFVFRRHSVYGGLGFGLIAWFLVVLYLALDTAPQLSGTLGSMSITSSIELLIPLALCFGLWGAAMGYVGNKY